MGPLQVVWFKRDLRTADHRPLVEASRRGAVLPLYVVEPDYWQQPDSSERQWQFCRESLLELRDCLARLGQPLVVRIGQVEQVLERAHRQFGIASLWSHEETGNGWTYARDLRVATWARHHSIEWQEIPQFGVSRRLASRQGWARRWEGRMAEDLVAPPPQLETLSGLEPGPIPSSQELALAPDPCPGRQLGGRSQGIGELQSFLAKRSRRYQSELSNPSTAVVSCSRLSPHLSWGTLSLREVVQQTRQRRAGLADATGDRYWSRSLQRFDERLHWHCHFIQKLESQPSLEFRELHPATAQLRSSEPERLTAWATGCTGLPFVDACMRSLIATGWLNFRMRAMLVSVASYQLWLPWQESGLHLARLFVDYEPGIHWSQCQMQSGTTGINSIRIYNPLKQGLDHDPQGQFIRRWIPELRQVPAVYLHRPWTMDLPTQERVGCLLGSSYPLPIVDWVEAAATARSKIWALRQQEGFSALASAIHQRHGSRRAGARSPGPRRSNSRSSSRSRAARLEAEGQLCLDLA
ncbi:cryptochrome/deoxyribodipyrimidine photo-lyase family protein [Cyanobium sp. WAJ14-Wanaka]|uniref:cryptochrome/deoxyribodipyrimidine photo-lyase family protein n=1 Tax=Cyanobium sp. WAJ14-Wanaka TaxID=2823725 RepID=UPI0020CD4FBC|nr:FAD-binding domain-containing protein [Cyanobium sp. WAJ14-Wanaka]MCP9774466.1 deoxyribodipyrimidine photo-lyase [Cyanobium sp. WAJ14-Wanaka]